MKVNTPTTQHYKKMIDFYKDAGGFLEPTHDKTTGDKMKKYIWEVGVDIQTIYLFPEADNADEAEMIAEDEMRKLTLGWDGFDFDYYASTAQIEGVTQEYAEYIVKDPLETKKEHIRENHTDGEVLDYLMDIAEVDTIEALEDILEKRQVKSITELEESITEEVWKRN